jgi:single-stranded DNA-binding protein
MKEDRVMHSQLYLSGKLAAFPETGRTKNDKDWVRLLLETQLVREVRAGELQSESVIVPISCFSREAQAVKHLQRGEPLTLGCHLYGTQFRTLEGHTKYGLQLVADVILAAGAMLRQPHKESVR